MKKKNGLSLIELIVAISILSIGIVFILRSFLNTISALDTSVYYMKSMRILRARAAEFERESIEDGGIDVQNERKSILLGNREGELKIEMIVLDKEDLELEEDQLKEDKLIEEEPNIIRVNMMLSWKQENRTREAKLETYFIQKTED